MRVLKVVAEGPTTSFRYPHFMLGLQPTFPMPPPATIYGHICSALGEWVAADSVRFGYHFTHEGRFEDLEHIHLVGAATGVLPETRLPKVQEGNINPFRRELLFRPRLTLYLDRPDWIEAFERPRYAVVLGRSQDLFTYTSVEVVALEQATRAYVADTLLPHGMALQVLRGVALTMPRWINPTQGRQPSFDRFLALTEPVVLPPEGEALHYAGFEYGPFWVDPGAPHWRNAPRAVIWHRFIAEGDHGAAL